MFKSVFLVLLGVFIGAVLTNWRSVGNFHVVTATAAPVEKRKVTAPVLKYPLHATLYRFTLNTANMPIYREWVQWHHDAYQPMIGTLDRERMYFESVFRDTVNAPEVIYWLAINGEGGETSSTSTLDIDKKHVEYMRQILVKGSRVTLKTEFTLLPSFLEASIAQHQQAGQ